MGSTGDHNCITEGIVSCFSVAAGAMGRNGPKEDMPGERHGGVGSEKVDRLDSHEPISQCW